jgi:hypothetical protein
MKLVIRTALFHLFCILLFSIIYFYLSDHFQFNDNNNDNNDNNYTDFFLLSTTVQAGVGISYLHPTSNYSKIALIIQQFSMLLTHIITLYIFTL